MVAFAVLGYQTLAIRVSALVYGIDYQVGWLER
jgi:hypothetical protein